jgi:hypothetical protein
MEYGDIYLDIGYSKLVIRFFTRLVRRICHVRVGFSS